MKTISIAATLALALPGIALAAPGDPLGGFGENGKVRTSLAPEIQYAGANAITRAGDGYVVAGSASGPDDGLSPGDPYVAIVRYTPGGELDPSFSEDGKLLIPRQLFVSGVISDEAGNIVVGGGQRNSSELVALAIRADGTVDTSFSGDGTASLDLGEEASVSTFERAADGRLTFGGRVGKGRDSDLFVAKLEPDGEPATGFSGDGVARVDFGAGEQGGAAASGANGATWIAGTVGRDVAIARLKGSGALDRRFSDDGKRLISTDLRFAGARAVAADRSGAVIAIRGVRKPDLDRELLQLLRVNGDGSIDRGYGRGGFARLGRRGFAKDRPSSFPGGLEIDHRRRAVVAASAYLDGNDSQSDFGLARFTRSGRIDTSFGRRGRVTTDFGGSDISNALLVERGRIVAAGDACYPLPGDEVTGCDTALAGYQD